MPETERKAKPQRRFRRVFVVGAGMSAGFSYPVGWQLLPELIVRLRGSRPYSRFYRAGLGNTLQATKKDRKESARLLADIGKFLETYFAVAAHLHGASDQVLESVFSEKVKVADFFSTAHALADMPTLFSPRHSAATSHSTLYGRIAAALRTYFVDIFDARKRCPRDIRSLFGCIDHRQDAIVSFNWDEELDFWLGTQQGDCDVAYTLGEWEVERGHGRKRYLLLKPHGSIGWYSVDQGLWNPDLYFIAGADKRVPRAEKRLVAFEEVALPLDEGDSDHPVLACPPAIAPPTFAKRFDFQEQQCIWQDVLQVCGLAESFVFLGYAMPDDDFLTRAAIRRALRRREAGVRHRCVIVTLDPENVKSNYKDVFGPEISDSNFLRWRFGARGTALQSQLEDKLRSNETILGASNAKAAATPAPSGLGRKAGRPLRRQGLPDG